MIAIDIAHKTFDLPENWTELVAMDKYLAVVRVNYTHTDLDAAKAEVFKQVTGVNLNHIHDPLKDHIETLVSLQLVEECLPVLDFIFKPELLTINPLPVITYKRKKYYGPGEKLAEQTGAEMEECGFAHSEWIKTGDEKYLNMLVAALYRPRRLSVGPRVKFSKAYQEKHNQRFAGLDPIVKRGVLLFYEMCEEWWHQSYEELYEAYGDNTVNEETEGPDSLANSRIVRALAGDKRGTVEQVRSMPRQEIYFELAELERERRALEKKK